MATLNSAGRSYANSLIAQGKVNKTAAWSFDAADGNALLGNNGDDWANFSRCHLGVNGDQPDNTKAHWSYPFAKGGTVYRSGLIAIRQRAAQQNDTAVYDAAGALIDKIDGEGADEGNEAPGETGARRRNAAVASGYRMVRNANSNGEIYLYGDIGSGGWFSTGITADQFRQDLKALGDVRTIDLRINSDGGDVFHGQAMYSLLNTHPAQITVHVDGLAASAASFVAMAGDQIRIGEAAFMMIHDAWGVGAGSSADLRRAADLLDAVSGTIADIYAGRTGKDVADIKTMMAAETWMSGSEAVKAGFADVLVENKIVVASVRDPSRFKNLPAALRPNRTAAQATLARIRSALAA